MARVWIKPGGWPDAEAAFAEAFARAPKIGARWKPLDDRRAWPLQTGGGTIQLIVANAVQVEYRSLRGGHMTWAVPAGARPGVLFEVTYEVSDRAAAAEASRVLGLAVAETGLP